MTERYAGAAVRHITPDLQAGPVCLAGSQADLPTTGAHDALYVRALASTPTSWPAARRGPSTVVTEASLVW